MPFVLQPFVGCPPDDDTLRHALGLDGDYLYVTATSALDTAAVRPGPAGPANGGRPAVAVPTGDPPPDG